MLVIVVIGFNLLKKCNCTHNVKKSTHGFLSLFTAAISLLKRLLEPDPEKRPNIHQVMADSWLQLGNPHTGVPYLNRSATSFHEDPI